jgi:hypothetical protein
MQLEQKYKGGLVEQTITLLQNKNEDEERLFDLHPQTCPYPPQKLPEPKEAKDK